MEENVKEVYKKWEPWILKWRRKLNIPDYEKEDFIQDVKEKLIHAALLYDDDREASFSSWSYLILRNYFYNRKRNQKNIKFGFENDSYEIYDLIEKNDIEENVLIRLSPIAKKVASIMWERENKHSEDFYATLRKNSNKRKLSIEKELRDFFSLSKNDLKKTYNEIKKVVNEVTNE